MKRYLVAAFVCVLILSGCSGLSKIEPDSNDASSSNKDESVGTGSADVEETKDNSDVNQTEPSGETDDQTIEPEVNEEEVENEIREELVDTLFVDQFSSYEAYTLEAKISELDNTETSWSFKRNETHDPVTGYYDVDLTLFGSYFIKDTEEKVLYLTFDEGYEEGYTGTILDVLKENNVKATFFITGHYLDTDLDLVQRMIDEGHTVANHTEKHPSMPTLSDEEIYNEISSLANRYQDLTGQEMAPFFRAPSGKYSERSLYLTRKLGYRTIFWSMAYKDWDTDDQPGRDAAYDHVLTNYHNGAIILLHAVSESNTLALDDILKDLKALGYRFGSLYELE